MKKVLKYIILLMALTMTFTVAFVSVTGLLKVFAGAGTLGLIIFTTIEIAKVVCTSAIHTYGKIIKWYYKLGLVATIILAMAVTSMGLYGFLSSSYKESFANLTAVENRVNLLEEKKKLLDTDKVLMTEQINSKRERIKDQSSIRGQQETRMDSLYAKNWYTAARRVQKSIDEANTNITKLESEIDGINAKLVVSNDSINSYNIQIIELNQNNEAASELGPLIYLADITGTSMDEVMKWFIFILIIIGDPQAVLLIIVFNKVVNSKKGGSKLSEGVPPSKNPTPLVYDGGSAFDGYDDAVSDVVSDAVNEPIKYEPSLSGDGYTMGIDVANEDSEPIIIKNETGEIVSPKKEIEQPTEYYKEYFLGTPKDDSPVKIETLETEEEFIDPNQLNIFDQPSEQRAEEVEEVEMEVVEEEEVIEEKPSESRAEFPENEINDIPEEEINDIPEDEVNDIPDESDFTEEKEVEEKPIQRKDIKGTGLKTEDGYKVKVRNPEDEIIDNKERIQEVLDEQARKEKVKREEIKEVKEQDRGFSVPIPDRGANQDNIEGDSTIFFKRKKNANK